MKAKKPLHFTKKKTRTLAQIETSMLQVENNITQTLVRLFQYPAYNCQSFGRFILHNFIIHNAVIITLIAENARKLDLKFWQKIKKRGDQNYEHQHNKCFIGISFYPYVRVVNLLLMSHCHFSLFLTISIPLSLSLFWKFYAGTVLLDRLENYRICVEWLLFWCHTQCVGMTTMMASLSV